MRIQWTLREFWNDVERPNWRLNYTSKKIGCFTFNYFFQIVIGVNESILASEDVGWSFDDGMANVNTAWTNNGFHDGRNGKWTRKY